MEIGKKLAVLDALYRIHENFCAGLKTACRRGCAHCCTGKVTMTTLEGYRIATHLQETGAADIFDRLARRLSSKRFVPRITTNRLAEACMRGEAPPTEALEDDAGPCPLLSDSQCPLYPVRPLGCRAMVSRIDCGKTGYADMEDFAVTVNTVLMQYLEHIDADGCSGNFADVLLLFASSAQRAFYREGVLDCAANGLVENRPVPALMIPPEHRQRIQPILEQIDRITV